MRPAMKIYYTIKSPITRDLKKRRSNPKAQAHAQISCRLRGGDEVVLALQFWPDFIGFLIRSAGPSHVYVAEVPRENRRL